MAKFQKNLMDGKSYKAKSVFLDDLGAFGGILDPFWPLGTRQRFSKKNLQCTTTYENTFTKFQKKCNGRLSGNKLDARTDGWTGLITIVPFRLKSGD